MFKSIILIALTVSIVCANTYRLSNDGIEYTIAYSTVDSYNDVYTVIECINVLRRQYSEHRIHRQTLTEKTNEMIKTLEKRKDVFIF